MPYKRYNAMDARLPKLTIRDPLRGTECVPLRAQPLACKPVLSQSDQLLKVIFWFAGVRIPPGIVQTVEDEVLCVRRKKGHKEVIRDARASHTTKYKMVGAAHDRQSHQDLRDCSLAALKQQHELLLEERTRREELNQQERIGYRSRRPYCRTRPRSVFCSGPDPLTVVPSSPPIIGHGNPWQPQQVRPQTDDTSSSSDSSDTRERTRRSRAPSPSPRSPNLQPPQLPRTVRWNPPGDHHTRRFNTCRPLRVLLCDYERRSPRQYSHALPRRSSHQSQHQWHRPHRPHHGPTHQPECRWNLCQYDQPTYRLTPIPRDHSINRNARRSHSGIMVEERSPEYYV